MFRGTLSNGMIEGQWVDVPVGTGGILGGGSMTIYYGDPLATEMIKTSTNDLFGAATWTKLYDRDVPGGPPAIEEPA